MQPENDKFVEDLLYYVLGKKRKRNFYNVLQKFRARKQKESQIPAVVLEAVDEEEKKDRQWRRIKAELQTAQAKFLRRCIRVEAERQGITTSDLMLPDDQVAVLY